MNTIQLDDLATIVIGLSSLLAAVAVAKRLPLLAKLNFPTPVLAGLCISVLIAVLRSAFGLEILFSNRLTDVFLLVFFTTVGLSAKFAALKAGGKPLVILCAVTLLLIVVQNVAGMAVATSFGAHPFYGLLVGSISCVGGPGTAAAWAKEAQTYGLQHGPEVAVGGATLAVVVGALVVGPITGWIVERHGLRSGGGKSVASWAPAAAEAEAQPKPPGPIEDTFRTLLLILLSALVGQQLNHWAAGVGFPLPGFLTAMLGGVLITNGADLLGKRIDYGPIERDGEFALHTFLVMYLMSLKLWLLGAAIVPLVVNVGVQVVVSVVLAYFVLFRLLGRDYDAAVTVGGFLGFGLSSMTVGMASMDKIAQRYGPSPKAFLLVTLAGSFFVDLANAFIVKGFLMLPLFVPVVAPGR